MGMRLTLFGAAALVIAIALGCGGDGGGGGGGGNSNRTACATNLKRLHDSLIAYANDNDDNFPAADWTDATAPYLALSGASFRCPSVEDAGFGYAFNAALVGGNLNSVATPDATALFFDSPNLTPNVVSAYPGPTSGRHGGDVVAFVSGRVEPPPADDDDPEDQRALCVSNLKKVATAAVLYTSDNDDRLPPMDWMDAVEPYAQGNTDVFRCPAVAVGSHGYAFNEALLGVNVTTIDTPTTTPLAFDSSLLTRNAVTSYALPDPPRHGTGVTAYLDGHVSETP